MMATMVDLTKVAVTIRSTDMVTVLLLYTAILLIGAAREAYGLRMIDDAVLMLFIAAFALFIGILQWLPQ